jgi:hypothetical protein
MKKVMSKKNILILLFILAFSVLIYSASFLIKIKKLPPGSVEIIKREYDEYYPGDIKIGGKMPQGPGGFTFGPINEIPFGKKFYVSGIQSNLWCSTDSCGLDGAKIQTMGGWVEISNSRQPEDSANFGISAPENKNISSLLIIGDKNGKIVGIYPNKKYEDALNILKQNHSDLANFNFLNGVDKFGKLKVGEYAPLKPGDNISNINIPKNKKFYLFGIQKKDGGDEYLCFLGGCRYPIPSGPYDFLFVEIEEMNGWFLANDNDNIKMIELFGLNPQEVLGGKTSIVVLTDAQGRIVALHPGKTLNDTITILNQHPELVDITKFYP